MKKPKELDPASKKRKRSGQKFLLAAGVLNAISFGLGLFLASLQGELDGKQADEFYFMRNDLAISAETAKRTMLHAHLNELKLLRRLAKGQISPEEKKALIGDERVFQAMIKSGLRMVAAATFLQAKEPPKGKGPDDIFAPMTEDQITELMPKLQKDEFEYAAKLKADQNSLHTRIGYWRVINSGVLALSTFFLVWGSYLVFRVEGVELGVA